MTITTMPASHKSGYKQTAPTLGLVLASLLLAACQSAPVTQNTKATPVAPATAGGNTRTAPASIHENGAKRTPLSNAAQPPLQSSNLPSAPGITPPKVAQPNVVLRDGSNIPAFRVLITRAQQQIQAAQFDAAEQTLIQAQRMAPQSTAVYAYLSQVALGKKQGSNAEAMARKGLMLTRNPRQQHAFWQLILAAAQLQNNAALATQAQQQMQQLSSQF